MRTLGHDCSMVAIRFRALARMINLSAADVTISDQERVDNFLEEVYLAADIIGTLAGQLDDIERWAADRCAHYKLEASR